MTNAELETIVDTNDEWIVRRTGIRERRIAADDETAATMATAAARDAMERGGFSPEDIDGIIVATTTPDKTFPSVAVHVQSALSIPPCMAFDIQAVCSGFVYALATADRFMRGGAARRILVIGTEKMSSILNWEDRTTCVLFGDGAGAVVLEAQDSSIASSAAPGGILSTHLYADGMHKDILYTTGGVSTTGTAGHIVMEGREVFKNAVQCMSDVVTEVLTKNDLTGADIDWMVPHQANTRIIEAIARKLDLPMERVVVTVDRQGNTSAASIPLALATAVHDGRIKRGDLVLMEALGAGLTWGAVLARF